MIKTTFPKSVYQVQKHLDNILEADEYAFDLSNYKKIQFMLENNAAKHSNELEFPTENKTLKQKKEIDKIKEESLKNYKETWNYLKSYVESGEELSSNLITKTLLYIEPRQQLNWNTGTRKTDVKITGATHQPPSPEKVPFELNEMIFHIKKFNTPLEKAIFAHYHITRIHPGEDGNGRCSRLVQNAFLHDKNYLPLIIKSEDRENYLETLANTDKLFYSKSSTYLHEFSEFLVSKMKSTIEDYSKELPVHKPRVIKPKNMKNTNSNKFKDMPKQKTHYGRFKR